MNHRSSLPAPVGAPSRADAVAASLPWVVAGVAAAALTLSAGLDIAWLLGAVIGMIGAAVAQRVHLTWFATTIRRSEGSGWMDRLPVTLRILQRPLAQIECQLDGRQAALHDATARDQVREMTVERLEMEVHMLQRALDDSRSDIAETLESIERALAAPSPEPVLRRELPGLRDLLRMNASAQLPSDELALGDVVAGVVAGRGGAGRVSVDSALPGVTAPAPLVETLVRAALSVAAAETGGVVRLRGIADGAMGVLVLSGGDPAARSVDAALLRRTAAILGGDVTARGGEMLVVIPRTFRAGVRAVHPSSTNWDLDAI